MQTIISKKPRFWRSWSSRPDIFEIGVDNETSMSTGRSGFVQSLVSEILPADWGGLDQPFGAYDYRGKRIRFSAQLKTQKVVGEAALFMMILGADKRTLLQEAMRDRSFVGSNDWTKCNVILDVPENARYINIGGVIRGMLLKGLKFHIMF